MVHTSYFAKQRQLNAQGLTLVSISKGTPKWFEGSFIAEDLQPSWDMIQGIKKGTMTREEYTEEYNSILSKLDPKDVYETLEGKVICCWEKPEDFCHRHLVSLWLRENGYESSEIVV